MFVFLYSRCGASSSTYSPFDFCQGELCATTGIAAASLSEAIRRPVPTLHSAFGISPDSTSADEIFRDMTSSSASNNGGRKLSLNRKLKRIKKLQILIIDELSFCSAEFFENFGCALGRIRESTEPWGGLQVVAFGDFCQLPPVGGGLLCFQSSVFWKTFDVVCSLSSRPFFWLNFLFFG